jgi:phosphatidylglycerophosphate synthase
MPQITLREIREFYVKSRQAEKEKREFTGAYSFQRILRKLSFYPMWLFLRIGMTANQVTLVAFLIGFLGCLSIATGTYLLSVVGAALLTIALFLDYVDGFIARWNGSASSFGSMIDGIYVLLLQLITLLAISIGLMGSEDHYLDIALNHFINFALPFSFYLIVGLWTDFVITLRWFLEFEFSSLTTVPSFDKSEKSSIFSGKLGFFFNAHTLFMTPIYCWPFLLLLASILRSLEIFLAIHALYHTLLLVAYVSYVLLYGRKSSKDVL